MLEQRRHRSGNIESTCRRHVLNPLVAMAADDLAQTIRAREVSCREVMQAYLDQIERFNPSVNAIVALREHDALLAEAAEKDAALARGHYEGWLHGMPQAPKDIAQVAGMITTQGSPIFRNNVTGIDGIAVARVRRAGAIFIGRTNTPEFGLGSHTFNEVYGATRNPYDAKKSAGGSSGGAAAALAMRLLPVADGSDFGGSLRNPAAFCNVYGMRPSRGRVPAGPAPERFIQQLGTEGPMGRTVKDVAMLLAIQAGYDARAPLSLAEDPAVFTQALDADVKGQRIGWLGDWNGYLPLENGIAAMCERGLGALRGIGCDVDALAPPVAPESLWQTWLVHRHLLVGGNLLALYQDEAKRALLKPEAVWEIEGMLKLSAAEVYAASVERSRWYDVLLDVFERFDYLAAPTAQVFPFDVNKRWPDAISGVQMDTYHRWMETVCPWTLSGCPVINVPVGFNEAGLPMGMQLIGRPRGDFALLQLARAYERECDWVNTILPPALADGIQ
ncbi:amidase [Trinickia sp. YCB016]